MTGRTIEVVVGPDGTLKIDAVAFQGADCEKATQFLEEALGQVSARQRKPEYQCRNRAVTTQRVGR